jgi:8-hydroxy-5-deazaflavin:NADPH oxidoreductase
MRIGILGTGNLASSLGQAWARAGHQLVIAGRSTPRATLTANVIGENARAVAADELAAESDVIVIAVAWDGLAEALTVAHAPEGSFAGKTVIDCTNAVDFTTGILIPSTGSAAQRISDIATGAHVVKALHLFAGQSWLDPHNARLEPRTVAICGDDQRSLDTTSALIHDLGASTAVIGGIDRARQLEDVAGFVMSVLAAGHNPATAVPSMEPAAPTTTSDTVPA